MEEKIKQLLNQINPEIMMSNSVDFVNDGLLDSLQIFEFMNLLEEVFQISIDGEDIIPENFQTVESILQLIQKQLGNSHE